jgi:hypothetical protein
MQLSQIAAFALTFQKQSLTKSEDCGLGPAEL